MSKFHFSFGKRKNAEKVNNSQPEVNQWEKMANEVNAEREALERQQASTERQQRKIVACFLTGDENWIAERDVKVSQADEEEFLRQLSTGEITERDEEDFLLKIGGPVHKEGGVQRVLAKLEQDEWQKRLFSWTTGANVNEKGIEAVFEQMRGVDLRTPVGFEQPRREVLEWLRPRINSQQYEHYEKSMDDLEKTLYGKRFEYYQAFEGLREKIDNGGGRIYQGQRICHPGSKRCIKILTTGRKNFCNMHRLTAVRGCKTVEIGD